jgi:hypothetical protein
MARDTQKRQQHRARLKEAADRAARLKALFKTDKQLIAPAILKELANSNLPASVALYNERLQSLLTAGSSSL